MGLNAAVLSEANVTEDTVRASIAEITREVFATMALMDVVDSYPLTESVMSFKGTLTGMVGFAGSHSGILSIHCPKDLAHRITSNMLGVEVVVLEDDVNDALGEIANLIGGDVKYLFSPMGGDIKLSLPTVIQGNDYLRESLSRTESLLMPFDCGIDRFLLSFNIGR